MFNYQIFKTIRKKSKLSQADVAKIVGKNRFTISAWENGIHTPSDSDIRILCEHLNIDIEMISNLQPLEKSFTNIDNHIKEVNNIITEYGDIPAINIKSLTLLNQSIQDIRKENIRLKNLLRYKDSFLDQIDSMTYVINKNYKFIDVNTTFLNFLNKYESDVLNNSWSNFFSINEIKNITDLHNEIFTKEKTIKNKKIILPNKKIGLASIYPLEFDFTGNLQTAACIIKDISVEEQLIDNKIKEENRRLILEATINFSNEFVWVAEINNNTPLFFKYSFLSKNIEKILGLNELAFKKDHWLQNINKNDKSKIIYSFKNAINLKEYIKYAHPYKGDIWLSIRIEFTYINKNNLCLLGHIRDVTKEENLIKKEQTLFKVFDVANLSIFFSRKLKNSNNTEYIYINKGLERLYERKIEEFQSDENLWLDVVDSADKETVKNNIARSTNKGQNYQFKLKTKDGKIKYVDENYICYKDEYEDEYFFGIQKDITENIQQKILNNVYNATLNYIRNSIFILKIGLDKKINFIFANKKYEYFYNIETKSFTFDIFLEKILHNDDINIFTKLNDIEANYFTIYFRVFVPQMNYIKASVLKYITENGIFYSFIESTISKEEFINRGKYNELCSKE